MTDVATVMRTELEALGPTNRIARQLVNRLELAEDTRAEAEVISDELDEIWQVITALTVRVAEAFERGIAQLEDEANSEANSEMCSCGHPVSMHWRDEGQCMASSGEDTWACECAGVNRP